MFFRDAVFLFLSPDTNILFRDTVFLLLLSPDTYIFFRDAVFCQPTSEPLFRHQVRQVLVMTINDGDSDDDGNNNDNDGDDDGHIDGNNNDDDGDANFEEPEWLPAAAAGQRSSRLQNRV